MHGTSFFLINGKISAVDMVHIIWTVHNRWIMIILPGTKYFKNQSGESLDQDSWNSVQCVNIGWTWWVWIGQIVGQIIGQIIHADNQSLIFSESTCFCWLAMAENRLVRVKSIVNLQWSIFKIIARTRSFTWSPY